MSELFNSGQRPAVDPGLSVSRVGGAAQQPIIKKLSGSIKVDLAQYRELQAFAKFGSDLDEATKRTIDHGQRLMEVLKQDQNTPLSLSEKAIILYAVNHGKLVDVAVEDIADFQTDLFNVLNNSYQDLINEIESNPVLSDEIISEFDKVITEVKG